MGRFLGIDPGSKRLGIAVSDESGTLASPLSPLEFDEDMPGRIAELAEKLGCRVVVVGLPVGQGGLESRSSLLARKLAQDLAQRSQLEVILWDERLSTKEAERRLAELGYDQRRRRKLADSAAATIILQSYLDSVGADSATGTRGMSPTQAAPEASSGIPTQGAADGGRHARGAKP